MAWCRIVRLAAALVTILLSGHAASAKTLRVGGVGAAMGMLPQLFAAFDRSEAIKLEAIPSLGTSGGLRALSEGMLDIAVAGRALTAQELARGMVAVVSVRTPFGLVTSHPKPNDLKSSEIAGIFHAAKATWADGSPIRIILRPKSDSDTAVLGGLFPDMAAAIERAHLRPELSVAATDQDNADLAERVSGSLTGSTLTQITTERRKLRFVPIDGVEPSIEGLESGAYPYAKTLHFVLPAKRSLAADRFIDFLLSPAGRAVLLASGNIMAGR